MQPEKAKGNEESERCLRSVCCRAERVQAEDRNALQRADLLGAFFRIGERLADEEVEEAH